MELKPTRIIALEASNVKRIKTISIKPDGNLIQITGPNGSGKTSTLDAIWWALSGTRNIQTTPIRKGTTEAIIKLDLGEVIVTRKFKSKVDGGDYTTTITVESRDGARFQSPQIMLDGLLGELTFDPLAFARAKPNEQFNTLRRFVPDVDFDEIDGLQRGDYERRTDRNRDGKQYRAAANAIILPDGTPDELESDEAVVKAIDDAGDINAACASFVARKLAAENEVARQELIIADARQTLADYEEKLALAKGLLTEFGEPPERVDVEALRATRDQIEFRNIAVKAKIERARLAGIAEGHEAESNRLTAAMDARDAAKQAAVAAAELPVKGITFGDNEVLLNGLPLSQASDAEQLRMSVAIAMAGNPTLRVIRIRDGSLLDDTGMETLAAMAHQADYQIWIERVDTTGKVGIVMEDGMVVSGGNEVAGDTASNDQSAHGIGDGTVKDAT